MDFYHAVEFMNFERLRSTAHDILITKFKGQIPRASNAAFNDDIKRVCEIAEINESIKVSYKKVTETLRK